MDQRAEIFRLLETGDNFVKYARPGAEERAAQRARRRYEQAAALAEQAGDEDMLAQARLRLDGAAARAGPPPAPAPAPATGVAPARTAETARPPRLRVPPGQSVTAGWPVLHEGPVPRFDPRTWRFAVDGACDAAYSLSYDELRALPPVRVTADLHCVTGWSKLDNVWEGVAVRVLVARAQPTRAAAHVTVHGEHGYTANLPLDALTTDDVVVAWGHGARDLDPEHGWPLRLVVPRLYAWKSVKWVRRLELTTQDRRGFWETRGYHNRADPWLEERYAYQER